MKFDRGLEAGPGWVVAGPVRSLRDGDFGGRGLKIRGPAFFGDVTLPPVLTG